MQMTSPEQVGQPVSWVHRPHCCTAGGRVALSLKMSQEARETRSNHLFVLVSAPQICCQQNVKGSIKALVEAPPVRKSGARTSDVLPNRTLIKPATELEGSS